MGLLTFAERNQLVTVVWCRWILLPSFIISRKGMKPESMLNAPEDLGRFVMKVANGNFYIVVQGVYKILTSVRQ